MALLPQQNILLIEEQIKIVVTIEHVTMTAITVVSTIHVLTTIILVCWGFIN